MDQMIHYNVIYTEKDSKTVIMESMKQGITLLEVAERHCERFEHDIVLTRVNGQLRELGHTVGDGDDIEMITTADEAGSQTYKRTACMIMTKAFTDVLGLDHTVYVHYSLGKGYYCEVKDLSPVSEDILAEVKTRMEEIVREGHPIIKKPMNKYEAQKLFALQNMTSKKHLFDYRRSSWVNVYFLDDYADYFYGYMAPDTSYIRYFDLVPYDEGFIFVLPDRRQPEIVPSDVKPAKLFSALKTATEWNELVGVRTIADLNKVISEGRFFDLVLVQEALMEKRIAQIADEIVASGKRVILIAGPSSSGKTTFSHRLSIQLKAHGMKPHPIPVDNYFVNRDETPVDEFGQLDFECLGAINLELLNQNIKDLLAGKKTDMPVFDFMTGMRNDQGYKLQIGEQDLLSLEGIHALNDEMTREIDKDLKFKIYISALTTLNVDEHSRIPTTDARLLRRMVRDSFRRGASAAKTIRMWPSVRRGEDANIFPYQENCDVMFNSVLIYELALIKHFAEPILFSVEPDQPEYEEAKRLLKFLDYILGVSSENIPNTSIIREFIGNSCFNVS